MLSGELLAVVKNHSQLWPKLSHCMTVYGSDHSSVYPLYACLGENPHIGYSALLHCMCAAVAYRVTLSMCLVL